MGPARDAALDNDDTLEALASVVGVILKGAVPPAAATCMGRSTLIALSKGDARGRGCGRWPWERFSTAWPDASSPMLSAIA